MSRKPVIKSQSEELIDEINKSSLRPISTVRKLRSNQISLNGDEFKIPEIGLETHDEAVIWYLENKVKPYVISNENKLNVPIIYGSPERWKSVQLDGFYRDRNSKIQVPLIMIKRTSISPKEDRPIKLDGNKIFNYHLFEKKYSKKNIYDNFHCLNNRIPQKEIYAIAVPDYINITYKVIIWTDFVSQMNKIIESINYVNNSYWGDNNKFSFLSKIENFSNITELTSGEDRAIQTEFDLNLSGYLLPDTPQRRLIEQGKYYSKSIVKINEIIEGDNSLNKIQQNNIPKFSIDGLNNYNQTNSQSNKINNYSWESVCLTNDNGATINRGLMLINFNSNSPIIKYYINNNEVHGYQIIDCTPNSTTNGNTLEYQFNNQSSFTVTHGFGRTVDTTVFINNQEVETEIIDLNLNQIQVNFNSPQTGYILIQ